MAVTQRKFVDYDNEAYIWEKTKNKFVEKETGKGLSEANYTQDEKAKLENIESGAEANVNADWNATTGDAAILNKPENLVQDASYVHTDSNYTADEKTKLSGIAAGAEVNVQADWNETDSTEDSFIANKPSIPSATSELTNDSNFVSDANYSHITVDNSVSDSSNNPISNSAIKDYVDTAIGNITGINFAIVTELPETGEAGTIYLISNGGSSGNSYDEYIWVNNAFEKIGTTDVDLSGYMQETDMVALTTAEIDAICV